MKQSLLIIVLAIACTAVYAQRAERPAPPNPRSPGQTASQPLNISQVSASPDSFNPSRGGKTVLAYQLSRDARTSVKVFDPDRQLVRVLATGAARKAGINRETWDGRDLDGKAVPNEAYFFTIEATGSDGSKVIYDPITFSGGEFADLTRGQRDRESGTVSYQLSQPSRVLLRAGMGAGLLLKTIVDWEPRSAGTITEYWNGKDEDGLIDVSTTKGTTMVLTYMTLPEQSVITIGNTAQTFRDYKKLVGARRPMKEDRPMANARKISPHFLKARTTDRAFKIDLLFPDLEKAESRAAAPEIKGSASIRIAVADADKEVLTGQQFELIAFVDTAFLFEEERGYVPFNSLLELPSLPPGEHVLTLNLITFGDQIGVGSRKIRVVR